jgi:predicted ribosomally synthesized peptide with SipW-like signal peptide
MTDDNTFRLSRRKVLAGLGTVGLASAGAGLGTTAYFSDEETFEDNVLTAGTLDLFVDYFSYVDQGSHGIDMYTGTADGEPAVKAELDDIKPGDSGKLGFCFRIEDNPAYLWMGGELTANDDEGSTEAEENHSDDTTFGDGEGDLADAIDVVVSYAHAPEVVSDPADFTATEELWSGTFADFMDVLKNGIPIDAAETPGLLNAGEQACFAGTRDVEATNPCLTVDWSISTDVGNEIQTDSLAFDMLFYAEQCRHNDGVDNPYFSAQVDTGAGDWAQTSYDKNMGMEILYGSSTSDPDATIGQTPHEINIHPAIGEAASQAQHAFDSGTAYPFEVVFDPSGTPSASITIDGVTVEDADLESNLQYNGVEQGPRVPTDGDLALTVRAEDFAGDVTTLEDVRVNGTPVGVGTITAAKTGSSALADERKYLELTGLSFTAPVSVTGTVTFEVDTSITDYRATPGLGLDWK